MATWHRAFSPIHANRRSDAYGGDLDGRGRFMLETLLAVRRVWPEHLPLTARFGMIEYDDRDEQTLHEAIELGLEMRGRGLDLINISLGFSTPAATIPWAPSFQAPIAAKVRHEVGLPVASSWGIDTPVAADLAVSDGSMDVVMAGRAHLADPHWPYKAALQLGSSQASATLPPAYAHWLDRYELARS